MTFNIWIDALIVEIAPITSANSIFPLEKIGHKARMNPERYCGVNTAQAVDDEWNK